MNSEPGTYALILRSSRSERLQIGRLGILEQEPGYYIYVGSAFGPGGLWARTRRHRRKIGASHWHIDYLKPWLDLREIWYTHDPVRREHQWAKALLTVPESSVPLPGFGSSDCRCGTHLVHFSSAPDFDCCCDAFRRGIAGHAPVEVHTEARSLGEVESDHIRIRRIIPSNVGEALRLDG